MAFKLTTIQINGLPGFESDLILDCERNLTTLIGPNGSGKTTTLTTVESIFRFLNQCQFDMTNPAAEQWTKWKLAMITFSAKISYKNEEPSFSLLGQEISHLTLTIQDINNKLVLTKIETPNGLLEIADPNNLFMESEALKAAKSAYEAKRLEAQALSEQITLQRRQNSPAAVQNQKKLDEVNQSIKEIESRIGKESIETINFSQINITRTKIQNFLQALELPKAKYIKFGETDFSDIRSSITKISAIRGGQESDDKYRKIKDDLFALIQQEPHFFHVRGEAPQDYLKIENVDFEKVSTGTKICIYYFSLVFEANKNDLILWDEPENGLHPTRRYKLLDLILRDSRQFIIATHSTELAPVFDARVNVVRTNCEFRSMNGGHFITFTKTAARIDAFKLADQLGLSPARLLFTANVSIWVEGPSDMIFWRHMLKLHPKGAQFVEGFDYSFLMYGGRCIAHLTALEVNEKLDIMAISSHPTLIVDSDFATDAEFADPSSNLKESAQRLYEIFHDPKIEAGRALFLYSLGREMENYLPADAISYALSKLCLKLKPEDLQSLKLTDEDWPKTEKYFAMLHRKFEAAKMGKIEDGEFKPKWHSRWGEGNKTEVVQNALAWPDLTIEKIRHGGGDQIEELVEFISRWQM